MNAQKKILVGSVLFFMTVIFSVPLVFAQDQATGNHTVSDTYYKARVIKILDQNDKDASHSSAIVQKIRVTILDGKEKGSEVAADNNLPSSAINEQALDVGDTIVLVKSIGPDGIAYAAVDLYRITPLAWILVFFIALVLSLGRWRGLMSLLGLAFSIGILGLIVIPRILAGHDPLMTCVWGALMIIVVSLYLAHGFNRRTSIALLSSLITLGIAVFCAVMFVSVTKLLGMGSETALYLQLNQEQTIDLRGLLLGGIIIGTLGVLDDVTTGQTAAVDELQKANTALSSHELYERGLSVGKEHIASLVNTLALAYAGVSLPLFLLFSINASQPFWVVLNGQEIAEEIVRTLVGSIALILAVPISTLLAAALLPQKK